ncbi:hypothetical protein [Paracoccus hibiscisoli]|nr:hypothetical protein [Paracoccus hibiscisoli]
MKKAKADAKAAALELRLLNAEQAERDLREEIAYTEWQRDQEGKEKAA